jgi:release factor glutamine methyltransferase
MTHDADPQADPGSDGAMTVAMLRREARARLSTLGDEAPAEADHLLAAALQRGRAWLHAHGEEAVAPHRVATFRDWLRRRAAGEPVAYLTGVREFWSLPLRVSPAVLVPRPDTETLVEAALSRLPLERDLLVADLGTGSGAIALAIASERPRARLVASDASADALEVAQDNARALGLADRVAFRHGDWWDAFDATPPQTRSLPSRFDMVVSNPPYIAEGDPHLAAGGLPFEPVAALASGPEGLDAIRAIIAGAGAFLAAGGWLLLEHGSAQGESVRAILNEYGFRSVQTIVDLEGRERVSLGRHD